MLTYRDGVYVCDTERDMVSIRAEKGALARVGQTEYRYNGGGWTKFDEGVEQKRMDDLIRRLDKPPYYVADGMRFYNLGIALESVWRSGESRVWLNGRHLEGIASIGDTLVVCGKKWRICHIECLDESSKIPGLRWYLLERVGTKASLRG